MVYYLCVPALTKSYTQTALHHPASKGTMPALSLQHFGAGAPTSIRATFPRVSREELPSATPSRSCTGSARIPHRSSAGSSCHSSHSIKGTRSVQRWDPILDHRGNFFKGLATRKGQKVHKAACTENTKKSVPNVDFFSTPGQPKNSEEGNFSFIFISQGCLNELSSVFIVSQILTLLVKLRCK